jgi:hypothetical protein
MPILTLAFARGGVGIACAETVEHAPWLPWPRTESTDPRSEGVPPRGALATSSPQASLACSTPSYPHPWLRLPRRPHSRRADRVDARPVHLTRSLERRPLSITTRIGSQLEARCAAHLACASLLISSSRNCSSGERVATVAPRPRNEQRGDSFVSRSSRTNACLFVVEEENRRRAQLSGC